MSFIPETRLMNLAAMKLNEKSELTIVPLLRAILKAFHCPLTHVTIN